MMRLEELRTDNLREGIFCAAGKPHGEEMYQQLEAWLQGDLLRGQLARMDDGEVAGFAVYYPIEKAPMDVDGEGLYMVQCVHVKEPYRGQGIGKALVESAVADAREHGASGLAVEAFARPDSDEPYLPGTFFQHQGMTPGESRGAATLYYVLFDHQSAAPRFLQPRERLIPGESKLRIDILDCRRCHLARSNTDLVLAVTQQLQRGEADVKVHRQYTREAILDKGMSSGVFVDGKLTYFQGPLSEDDIWDAIEVARAAHRTATDR